MCVSATKLGWTQIQDIIATSNSIMVFCNAQLRRGKRKEVDKGWEEWMDGFYMHGSGSSNSGQLMRGEEKEGVGRSWGELGKPGIQSKQKEPCY